MTNFKNSTPDPWDEESISSANDSSGRDSLDPSSENAEVDDRIAEIETILSAPESGDSPQLSETSDAFAELDRLFEPSEAQAEGEGIDALAEFGLDEQWFQELSSADLSAEDLPIVESPNLEDRLGLEPTAIAEPEPSSDSATPIEEIVNAVEQSPIEQPTVEQPPVSPPSSNVPLSDLPSPEDSVVAPIPSATDEIPEISAPISQADTAPEPIRSEPVAEPSITSNVPPAETDRLIPTSPTSDSPDVIAETPIASDTGVGFPDIMADIPAPFEPQATPPEAIAETPLTAETTSIEPDAIAETSSPIEAAEDSISEVAEISDATEAIGEPPSSVESGLIPDTPVIEETETEEIPAGPLLETPATPELLETGLPLSTPTASELNRPEPTELEPAPPEPTESEPISPEPTSEPELTPEPALAFEPIATDPIGAASAGRTEDTSSGQPSAPADGVPTYRKILNSREKVFGFVFILGSLGGLAIWGGSQGWLDDVPLQEQPQSSIGGGNLIIGGAPANSEDSEQLRLSAEENIGDIGINDTNAIEPPEAFGATDSLIFECLACSSVSSTLSQQSI